MKPSSTRERNKADKHQRIRDAARTLFSAHGYDATTMRSIASQAGVGHGTLFSYADDKRDLVFLIVNDDFHTIADRAAIAANATTPLIDQLIAAFSVPYETFAASPVLFRLALQELTFYSTGKQSESFLEARIRYVEAIEAIIAGAQRTGQVRATEPAQHIARLIFFIYTGAVRWWIGQPEPQSESGLRELRQLLTLQVEGLAARG